MKSNLNDAESVEAAGRRLRETEMAMIQLDRRAEAAGGREVKFALQIKPLDHTHTHGELERCDKEAVMAALAKCATEIVEILKKVPPKPL